MSKSDWLTAGVGAEIVGIIFLAISVFALQFGTLAQLEVSLIGLWFFALGLFFMIIPLVSA